MFREIYLFQRFRSEDERKKEEKKQEEMIKKFFKEPKVRKK